MIDERELERHFAGQPKPVLRPFLATRVAARARSKPWRMRTGLHLIWTAVMLACLAACAQVRLPVQGALVLAAVLFAAVLTLSRRSSKQFDLALLFTGHPRRGR
jgi:hypothetical protein